MKFSALSLLLLLASLSIGINVHAQTELGLTREQILNLSWVKSFYNDPSNSKPLPFGTLNVRSSEYHYTFRFSVYDVCIGVSVEARSYDASIKLRSYLQQQAQPLSMTTYIGRHNGKRYFACILATKNSLPHHVSFSYEQLFKTNTTPRIVTEPYEIN